MLLEDTAEKIKSMEIRGAGRIARAAAAALKDHSALYIKNNPGVSAEEYMREMKRAGDYIAAARPTAVSLPNAVIYVLRGLSDAADAADALEADSIVAERADTFIRDSENAVKMIAEAASRRIRDGDVVMTHCNSDAAVSTLVAAKKKGIDFEVFATEVRPRNQGHLTIKALNDAGIKTNFIVDSAVRCFMKEVDTVITGCDAVAVNGAVVNKIGTSQIALCAHEARVPFIVCAETYKFAPKTLTGTMIEIEERTPYEVAEKDFLDGLSNVTVRNPAFDVTPAEYIDLIVTEKGAIPPEMAYIIIRDCIGLDTGSLV